MTDCGQGRGGEAESRLGPSLAWVVRAQRGHLCSGDGARHSSRPEGLCHALGRVRRGLLALGPPEWGLTLLPTPCSSALPTHLAQGNGVHKKEVVILPAEARVQLLLHDEDDIGWDDVGALGRRDQGVTRTSWLCDMPSSCLYWFPCLHLNNDEIRPGFLERPLQFGSIAPPLRSLPRPPITSPLLSMLKYTRSAGVGQASSGHGHSTELMSDNCLQVSVLLGHQVTKTLQSTLLGTGDRAVRLASTPKELTVWWGKQAHSESSAHSRLWYRAPRGGSSDWC